MSRYPLSVVFAWTDETIDQAVALFANGASTASIAGILDTTKDVVGGKLRALGLRREGGRAVSGTAKVPLSLLSGNETMEITQAVKGSVPRPWITRTFGECAWPIDHADGPMSCCAPRWPGSPYCRRHHRLGTRPTPPSLAATTALAA